MKPGRAILAGFMVLLAIGFVALGIWQLERRAWKHALIEAVASRSTAAPVAAPRSGVSAEQDAYRRVQFTGQFRHDQETLVRGVSDLGSGYWVMTPLVGDGATLIVNRGFVLSDKREAATRSAANVDGRVTVTGLLRVSEPKGGFLRTNDPETGNWYSRDIPEIARAHGIPNALPYFIDADATPNPGGFPKGGLTVVRFNDHHMAYALTWFAMALGALAALWLVLRQRAVRP